VPKANLLGVLNGGWDVAITVLMHERMAIGNTVILHQYINSVLDLARRCPRDGGVASADPVLRQALAQVYIEGRALGAEARVHRDVQEDGRGGHPNPRPRAAAVARRAGGARRRALGLPGPLRAPLRNRRRDHGDPE